MGIATGGQIMSPHEWQLHKDNLCHQCLYNKEAPACPVMEWMERDLADVPTSRIFRSKTCSQYAVRPPREPRRRRGAAAHA